MCVLTFSTHSVCCGLYRAPLIFKNLQFSFATTLMMTSIYCNCITLVLCFFLLCLYLLKIILILCSWFLTSLFQFEFDLTNLYIWNEYVLRTYVYHSMYVDKMFYWYIKDKRLVIVAGKDEIFGWVAFREQEACGRKQFRWNN